MSTTRSGELADAEDLVRSGQVELARRRIQALSKRKSWRPEHRFLLARAARLSHLPELTWKLLRRRVDPTGAGSGADEVGQFAAALIQLGAPREALLMLSELDDQLTLNTRLYRAFAFQALWQHDAAILELRKGFAEASRGAPS